MFYSEYLLTSNVFILFFEMHEVVLVLLFSEVTATSKKKAEIRKAISEGSNSKTTDVILFCFK